MIARLNASHGVTKQGAAPRARLPAAESFRAPVARRVPRILLAEDDAELRRVLSWSLRQDGFRVTEAEDGGQLLAQLASALTLERGFSYDLIISDIRMPGVTGMEVLAGLKSFNDSPPVVLITAFGDEATHAEAERFGAAAVFDKPFDVDHIRAFVRGALRPVVCSCTGPCGQEVSS